MRSVVVAAALVASCSKAPPKAAEPTPPTPIAAAPIAEVTIDAAPPIDAAAAAVAVAPPPVASKWVIAAGRVGSIELGKPLPAELVTAELGARYAADYIADAQAVDTFTFTDPPLTVFIAGGPFERKVKGGFSGAPLTDALRDKAVAAVKAGAKVKMVMIRGAGPATAEGFGVGAHYPDLKAAYPKTFPYPRPPTEDDRGDDGCVVESSAMKGVGWVYRWCKGAEQGEAANRVDLWIPES